MGIGNNLLALYAPLQSGTTSSGGVSSTLTQTVPGAAGWWDASFPGGLIGPGNMPVTVWQAAGNALSDLSGNGRNLVPYCNPTSASSPLGSPHLSGLLGGVGYPVTTAGLLQPALDPACGWQLPGSTVSGTASWSWYLVWSRPNWRQGTSFNANPITLLTIGSQPILQVDSYGGNARLVLFPGASQMVLSSSGATPYSFDRHSLHTGIRRGSLAR